MLNDLAQRIAADLQRNLSALPDMIPARELKAAVQSALTRLDLVTREEFDAQAAVLQRTRLRLEELEKRVAELEQQAGPAETTTIILPPQ
jgi:BMFP domain-containing protein YqiC